MDRDLQDVARSALAHPRGKQMCQPRRDHQVHRQQRAQLLPLALQVGPEDANTSVVHQHVDGAVAELGMQLLARSFGSQVQRDAARRALVPLLQLRRQRLQPLGATRHQHQLATERSQLARDVRADAARGSGHQRTAPVQPRWLAHAVTSPGRSRPRPNANLDHATPAVTSTTSMAPPRRPVAGHSCLDLGVVLAWLAPPTCTSKEGLIPQWLTHCERCAARRERTAPPRCKQLSSQAKTTTPPTSEPKWRNW